MPGRTKTLTKPDLTAEERALRDELRRDLEVLAGDIGVRNAQHPRNLQQAVQFIEERFAEPGLAVERQSYDAMGLTFHNLGVEIRGSSHPDEIVVVGAHYDSVAVEDCPGANDNGTGVVALFALARRLAGANPSRTLRLVAFANEEPPFFQTEMMGSRVYARRCRERNEKIVGMLSLETMGCFSEAEGSQNYPPGVGLFYPSRGNFIAFVGNVRSRKLVRSCVRSFRASASIPAVAGALPSFLPGVGWSDQWSFWQEGYRALMVTDTAPYRYAHYHTGHDTIDKVHFDGLSRVVAGLTGTVRELVGA